MLALPVTAMTEEPVSDDAHSSRLFNSFQSLEVVLTLPWQAIVTDEFFFQGGYPSQIAVIDARGRQNSLALETERRGMSRQVICRYPPIKLRFKKEQVKGTVFQGQKSLKLVTHCDKGVAFEQYQVLEALAYRMYNLVTDLSFRVRPLSVTYVDSDTGKSDGPRFAFLVEDDSEVAKRNEQKKLKIAAVSPSQLDPRESSRLSLFQYMIGNTAWSLQSESEAEACCNNIKLIGQVPDVDPIYAIPNDFDSSGLVNAHYAKPPEGLQIDAVTERLFRGFCVHNASLNEARQHFLDKEADIRSLIENENRLLDDSKEHAVVFLDAFFDVLRDPQEFDKEIIANCRD
jgi:hypothetical protein